MSKLFGLVILAQLVAITAFAQPGFNWPDNEEARAKANEKYVVLTDGIGMDTGWETTRKALVWLLKNTPDLNKGVYQSGAKVYQHFVKTDKANRNAYEDTTLMMFDQRIKYFGDEANVLNRKGLYAWSYWKDRSEKIEELYNLYAKIHELNANKTYISNLVAYMDLACKQKKAGKLDDMQVMDVFDKVMAVIEANADNPKYNDKGETIEKILATDCIQINVDFVKTNWAPKFKETQDPKLAKKIISILESQGANDDPLYFEAYELIVEKEPSCGGVMRLAKLYKRKASYAKSLEYFNKALETCGPERAGEIYFEMADIYNRKGDKVSARTYANKSIAAGDQFRAASYTLIGDLYAKSAKECLGENQLESRLIYLAAYEKYEKAGHTAKMKSMQAQFPSVEDIFMEKKQVGDKMTVGCWVKETVTLRKRP